MELLSSFLNFEAFAISQCHSTHAGVLLAVLLLLAPVELDCTLIVVVADVTDLMSDISLDAASCPPFHPGCPAASMFLWPL